ncbi:Trk system potassium transporter TrkA [Pseudemcibacter aquimaris]|uniref:Trk system potassium transporter TrkA n=1 Tax=Pseudemcibacter aquimaris TaxID=2857064 RepID=UPI0020120D64|nr:Trk system potassium transporter TrkA [Pseudemcibacter aquimaris]MCC3860933.1 Trk system potassium transporter TrkA [Pseudemcibacter aquimaris]WDU59752.1 Trk system potassium transporter TrkA [Pseudemcibacter aquimaris]
MKVIVCGAGQVGYNIARHLAHEQNDVTVIDRSEELINKVRNSLDVHALVGYASYPDLLESAGAEDADMIIAVTLFDEVNMVACQVAHSLFNVPTKIARIRAQNYLDPQWQLLFSREHMPIDVIISPEIEVAKAAINRLEVPGATDMIRFADDRIRVVGVKLEDDCPVVDTPLRQLTELFPDLNIVVCGILRNGKLIVPSGDDHLLVGDNIYIASEKSHVPRALSVFGHEEEEARNLIIVGGGNVGTFLSEQLLESDNKFQIKIIERDEKRAFNVAEKLSKAVVLHGDALDMEILKEANIYGTESIVSVTNDDKVNILSALLAKQMGCKSAITLINDHSFGDLTGSVGIDAFVDPRQTTVSSILKHMRRGRISSLQSLAGGEAEVMEAVAVEGSSLVGKPLRDVKLPTGIIIGSIIHDGDIIVPKGKTIINAGDTVIVFTCADMIKKVEELFSVRLEYF